jgi:hypothetical protein
MDLVLRAGKTSFDNMSPVVRKMREQAEPNLRRFADKVGKAGVANMKTSVNELYNTNRPASRRRYPGSLRLGSGAMFDYRVIPYRSGDAATQFIIRGSGGAASKFKALNFGSDGHRIKPVKKRFLAFPEGDGAKEIDTSRGASWEGIVRVGKKGVRHPGTTGTHFFEKSIAKARRTTRP